MGMKFHDKTRSIVRLLGDMILRLDFFITVPIP